MIYKNAKIIALTQNILLTYISCQLLYLHQSAKLLQKNHKFLSSFSGQGLDFLKKSNDITFIGPYFLHNSF